MPTLGVLSYRDQGKDPPGFIPWFLRLGGQVALFSDADGA